MVKQNKLKNDERLGYNSKPTSSVRNITNDELITKLINI